MFVLPTFSFGVVASPTTIPETFDTATLENGGNGAGNDNTLTFTVNPSASISAGATLTIAGLTGSQTSDSGSLTVGGAGASIFGSSGSWTQSSGTLVLTVAGGQSVPTGSDTVITFTLTNPATTSSGVTGITLASSGFTTANISGTFLNAVATFNVTTRDTEANILASTPTNPSGEVNIAFGTDTNDFYIYDGSAWYIYKNFNDYSVNFDGTDDYMAIADADIFSLGNGSGTDNAFSISAWFNADSIGTFYIATKDASSAREWAFRTVSSQLHFFAFGTGGGYIGRKYATNLSVGQWYHAVVTYDASKASSGIKLYLNGTRVDNADYASGTYTASVNTTAEVRLGGLQVNNTYADGKIDEVAIFNAELSASDVTAIYNKGEPTDTSSFNPVGWWRMGDNDGGTGTSITDQGSGGNNGTLTNGPTFSTTVP